MKKVFLALFVLLIAWQAQAQDNFVPELSVGLKGGVNYSRFNFDPEIDQEFLQGYTAGVVLRHVAHPRVGIQVEVNYVERGWRALSDTGGSYTRNLNYLELPFLTHVTIGNRNTRFIINFGPYASYLLSGDEGNEQQGVDEEPDFQYRSLDSEFLYGLSMGLGMVQKTSFGSFQLEGRLTHSLNNVFERNLAAISSKSQSISITLSYLRDFKLKKK
ncbi:porin family protein [Pontibacter flavimaris]|nr:porin family protein [Pontibacter flavimaris]